MRLVWLRNSSFICIFHMANGIVRHASTKRMFELSEWRQKNITLFIKSWFHLHFTLSRTLSIEVVQSETLKKPGNADGKKISSHFSRSNWSRSKHNLIFVAWLFGAKTHAFVVDVPQASRQGLTKVSMQVFYTELTYTNTSVSASDGI